MYDKRIGIISEGALDQLMISRIISMAYPEQSFVFTNISPTEDEIDKGKKEEGFGWGGVYKTCKHLKDKLDILRAAGMMFDMLVIHVDGDVMMFTYESSKIEREESDGILPCYRNNVKVEENCRMLKDVIKSWNTDSDERMAYCIPYINTDAWAAYAMYDKHRDYITQDISKEELENFLLRRNKKEGRLIRMHQGHIKKDIREYREAAESITVELLKLMRDRFSQLDLFCADVSDILGEY